nr:polysaccharide pyruvyl transferase CsaB [Thalassobacillus pellis]
MHIVLSGYYGFDNVGDEAILFSIVQALKGINPDIKLTVLSNNPETTKATYGTDAVNRWKIKDVISAIKSSDGLISGGGSLLQDETGMKSIPYYAGIMKIGQWLNKPVFVYAQGMGPIKQGLSKWMVKKTLNKVDLITVRDEDSKALLEKIGVTKSSQVVPDPVMSIDAQSFTNEWLKKNDVPSSYIAVSIRDWSTTVDYKVRIANALDHLVQQGNTIVFVPMHGKLDEIASYDIVGMMREASYVAPGDASIQEKISLIGQSRLLIGMRLHSLIFSAINHTPFVAISYDPKIDSFSSICEQPVAGHVGEENWDSQAIITQVENIMANEANHTDLIRGKAEVLQKEAFSTPQLAVNLFSQSNL